MNKTEYKRSIKNIKSLLGLLSASIVLLLIDVLIININGAYYGNWFQKYVSFLKDNFVYPKRKVFFTLHCFSTYYYLLFNKNFDTEIS